MIVGIGNDIVHISRIAESVERYGKQFLDKVFTADEQAYCNSRHNHAQHYAVRFAAKEAFSKAIGTGWTEEFSWKDISVTRNSEGKPSIALQGTLAERWAKHAIHLSLSHTTDMALATVIIEQAE